MQKSFEYASWHNEHRGRPWQQRREIQFPNFNHIDILYVYNHDISSLREKVKTQKDEHDV